LKPGLVVRQIATGEMAEFRTAVSATGLYEDPDRVVDHFLSNRSVVTVVVWRGRILQYETYHVPGTLKATVGVGLALRSGHERPSWFWRECQRPIWEMLLSAGHTMMIAHLLATDREDFIQGLKDRWAVDEVGRQEGGKIILLRYDIPASLKRCVGWPERRTAGAAWAWTRGSVLVREVLETEYPACRARIVEAWGMGHPRAALSLRVFDDGAELDMATVIISEIGGSSPMCDSPVSVMAPWQGAPT